MMRVTYELVDADARVPERATGWSAGHDVFAHLTERGADGRLGGRLLDCRTPENQHVQRPAYVDPLFPDEWQVTLPPGWRMLVPTGVRARLYSEWEAQVRPRSGLAWKHGLTVLNTPGTIDADYPQEWYVQLVNTSHVPYRLRHGERVAQVVLARYMTAVWEPGVVTPVTERRGGHGSTG